MTTQTEAAYTNGVPNFGGYSRYTGPQIPDDVAEQLVEWDWGGSYEYEMLVIYKSVASDEIRAAVDAGCSCPTPFSDLTWDTMRPVTSVDDVLALLDAADGYGAVVSDPPDETLADIKAFIHRWLRDHDAPSS